VPPSSLHAQHSKPLLPAPSPTHKTHLNLCKQRLHPNHEQPKNASTKFDSGWLLFFRPAVAAASRAEAREAFHRFIDCCNRPLDYLAAANNAAAAAAPTTPSAAAAAAPQWPPAQLPAQSPTRIQQQQQQQQPLPSYPPPNPWGGPPAPQAPSSPLAAAGTGGGTGQPPFSYPPGELSRVPSRLTARPLQLRPADAPPELVTHSPTLLAAHAYVGGGGGGGDAASSSSSAGPLASGRQQGGGAELDPLVAWPGETDQAFAQRLARMYGGFSAAVKPQGNGGTEGSGGGGSGGSGGGGGGAAAAAAAAAAVDEAPSAPPATVPAAEPSPSAAHYHALPSSTSSAAAAAAGAASSGSAPVPAPASAVPGGGGGGGGGGGELDEEDTCIICLTNERQIGLLHGSSVHLCVCRECALLVKVGGSCPLCREKISAILNVY